MRNRLKVGLMFALALLTETQAHALAMNNPPPAGTVVLDLNGTPVPHTFQSYTTANFTASATSTNISFAFREDPNFLSLDDVTVRDVTTSSAVTLVNGGFELGIVGQNAPVGWTYLNVFGAGAAGVVSTANPHTGSNSYYDGAIQAYDAITQAISTTVGDVYNISFFLNDNGSLTTFSRLSTNGNVTNTGGNGIDVVVYAGAIPTIANPVPEPATLASAGIAVLVGLGVAWRRRRAVAAA